MSAFDRMMNYSGRVGLNEESDVFDVKTVEGALFNRIHSTGFALYEKKHILKDISLLSEASFQNLNIALNGSISDEQYSFLCDSEKEAFVTDVEFTELYNVLVTSGNQEINAIAGAGKTTSIVFKIIHDIVTGEIMRLQQVPGGSVVRVVDNCWVCTFLRTGAEELQTALLKWQRKLGYSQSGDQIVFSTLDAEFKRCLNAMGVETNIGSPEKLNSLLKQAIDSCNISRADGGNLTKEDYKIIGSVVTYYRGRLDDKKYQHPSAKDYGLLPTILDLLVSQFANLRRANNIVDFDEVQEALYENLYTKPNKAVQDFISNRYNYIYIDEFQDTSQMQYAILKFYARGHLWMNCSGYDFVQDDYSFTPTNELYTGVETKGKIVVVGDPSQCIYSFKGSDSRILSIFFDKDFRPTLCSLSYNYRCPSEVLNPVIKSIHKNWDSANQVILPYRQGGEFNAYCFTSFQNMVRQLRHDIENDMKVDNTVAVLCRTNYDGMIPAFILEADHRYDFSISGVGMTMNSPLPKKLLGITSLFIEKSTPTVRTSLEFFVGRGEAYSLKTLMSTLKMNSKSVWDIPLEDLEYSVPSLVWFIKQVRPVLFPDGVRTKDSEMNALRFIYGYMMVNVFGGQSVYCMSARAYIETLLYVMDSNNFRTIYDFLEEIDLLSSRLEARINKKKAPIQIATVHEFKGKERDSVIIWNDSDGVFPSSKADLDDQDQLDEERRVHYIACTRAKRKSSIYSLAGRVGLFVTEMDCKLVNPVTPQTSLKGTQ